MKPLAFKRDEGALFIYTEQGCRIDKIMHKPEDRPAKVMFTAKYKAVKLGMQDSSASAQRLCQQHYNCRDAVVGAV